MKAKTTNSDPKAIYLESVDSEDDDSESSPPDYQIVTYPADYTLAVLHRMWLDEEITVPAFQRAFVWNQKQSSRLIESFLAGLPVPAIFLYRDDELGNYLVIDGQQRLRSVFDYFAGFFGAEHRGKKPVFRLKGLHKRSPFSEKSFDDLDAQQQRALKNSVLRTFVVRQLVPDDDTSIYHIFERLNTGGTSLANQEVRNCVYHGRFAAFLEDVNDYSAWRSILGKPAPDRRKRDCELILRFLALQTPSSYKRTPMKDFLSGFMRRNRNADQARMDGSAEIFKKTCSTVLDSLGDRPFHVRTGLNTAVFDAVMYAVSRHLESIPPDLASRYAALVENEEFERKTRSNTTDVEVVRSRLNQATEVLFGAARE